LYGSEPIRLGSDVQIYEIIYFACVL
jgi:hypothetical protein